MPTTNEDHGLTNYRNYNELMFSNDYDREFKHQNLSEFLEHGLSHWKHRPSFIMRYLYKIVSSIFNA